MKRYVNRLGLLLLCSLVVGCEEMGEGPRGVVASFDPPSEPPHDDSEEGYMHARGKDTPFLCHDPGTGQPRTCPTDGVRPERRSLSCDAAGCHGDAIYEAGEDRHLLGSDGPSCWTCHDQEWSTRTEASRSL